MDTRPDPDLALRKEIAADAAEPEGRPTIFVRAGQFFLVPLGILAALLGIYLLFSYVMVSEPHSARELLSEIRSGGAVARKHASHQLVQVVIDQARRGKLDPALFDPLLSLFNE